MDLPTDWRSNVRLKISDVVTKNFIITSNIYTREIVLYDPNKKFLIYKSKEVGKVEIFDLNGKPIENNNKKRKKNASSSFEKKKNVNCDKEEEKNEKKVVVKFDIMKRIFDFKNK